MPETQAQAQRRPRRSSAGFATVLKNFRRVAPHPWVGLPLARLELEKRFFNLLHPADFARRFGFRPKNHRGWIGDWKLTDTAELERQFARLEERSRPWSAPPVTFIPHLTGLDNLRAYYTDHTAAFGYKQCVSIHQVIEVNSNGDVSPCRDYHDYVVGNVKNSTLAELWNGPAYRKFRQSLHEDGLMPVCRRCCGLMGY